jgi:peptide/nickel transport system permease protein
MAQTLNEVAAPVTTEERTYVASQWQLMWWRFRKHRLAIVATVVVILLYTLAIFAEFFATHDPNKQYAQITYLPPQRIHFEGLSPFVYGVKQQRNPETLGMEYSEDTSRQYFIQFFARGLEYKLLGLFTTDVHFVGVFTDEEPMPLHLFGADRLGRDMWSRIMYATRISLSIGLVGVAISLFLGILLGGISGYYGGLVDVIIQRVIEFLRSIPTIPLWLALSAAVPAEWTVIQVYFAITVLLSLIGWTGLARVVRGRFLSLREQDFVMSARLAGTSELGIIFRHMLPSFLSHIIASTTLAIPSMILSETSLSFLGLGLRPPAISWGILLNEAQNLQTIANAPWLLIPGVFVIVTILGFNFMGDGLRDAADPYG